ncbi:MAG: hypothetical protein M0P12_04850 [Paludibacteraceae bacterium]|nr:hypothetical protein [Paludibacteraceae bacterium]HOU69360.1 hypothetical protein [Paludibacteraceae bacterium]HQF51119.1 hypothetical protein [Paludibacteraceae bacterium]
MKSSTPDWRGEDEYFSSWWALLPAGHLSSLAGSKQPRWEKLGRIGLLEVNQSLTSYST